MYYKGISSMENNKGGREIGNTVVRGLDDI